MVKKLRSNATVVMSVIFVLMAAAGAASPAREEPPVKTEEVIAFAEKTSDPVRLDWALRTLALIDDREATEGMKRLLTQPGRLALLRPDEKKRPKDMRLGDVLVFAAQNMSGARASALFMALYDSREYGGGPTVREGSGWGNQEEWNSGIETVRRNRALTWAAGYVEDPSPELVKSLRRLLEEGGGPLGHNRATLALAMFGTDDALAILHEMSPTSVQAVARWRDRPNVFKFMVDAYLRSGKEEADAILTRYILARRKNYGTGYIRYPSYSDAVSGERAGFYAEQFGRLLKGGGKRKLTGREREKVESLHSLLKTRAEIYEDRLPPRK